MGIQKLREEFEKLPEIAGKLKHATWVEKYNQYLAKDIECKEKDLHFLDGAWYAFQEQQKKIDKAIEYLDSIEGLVWYEQIKDILK